MSLKPPNPEDSIRSTWRRQDKKDWMWQLWVIDLLNIHHVNLDQPVPKHPKTNKVPYVKQWSHTLWVSFFSVFSLLVHQLLLEVTGYYNPSAWVVGAYYFIAYQAILTHEVHILRRLAHKYGFFDGDQHERNEVPDVGVPRAFSSLVRTLGSRVVMNILVAYDGRSPFEFMSNPSWWKWLVVKLALYPVILDFYFYSYHRIMHEVPFLWKFHRKHHLIKHPVPLLSAYADDEQEFFDMVGVPFLTYLTLYAFGIRLGYYDWWVAHQFITYTEAWGHSGLRLYSSAPSTIDWLLPLLKLDLTVEDHDLHHRKGWRKSANYGKQTLIWDRVFGTAGERIEVADGNIDRSHGVRMPLF